MGLGLALGREGTASALVATATATAPCVSVTRSTLWPLASRAQKHLHLDCDRRSKSKPPPAGAQIGDRAGGSRVAPSAAALSKLARARTRITARGSYHLGGRVGRCRSSCRRRRRLGHCHRSLRWKCSRAQHPERVAAVLPAGARRALRPGGCPAHSLCADRLAAERHRLVRSNHHIVMDGWSMPRSRGDL